jgi:nucleoid DNA-binding protein
VTKADIVNQISNATGLTKTDTAAVVEGFLATVSVALQRGEHVEIRGFGTFKVVTRASRTGRNPKTGEVVKIPERPVPSFKPSRELRTAVEDGRGTSARSGQRP